MIDLSDSSDMYNVFWFKPRTGELDKRPSSVEGGGKATIPSRPDTGPNDVWLILIEKK